MSGIPGELNADSMEAFGVGRLFWLTHDAVVGADLETARVVTWNPSAERIFGYSSVEAIGMPLDRLVPTEMLEAHHAGIARYRAMGPPLLVGGPPVEVPAVAKSGELLTVSLTLTAVDLADERSHVVAVIRDVTAQKAAEQDRRRSLETMQSFIATASHDLRTPLTTMVGFARILVEQGGELAEEQRAAFASRILGAGERATRLVDDLLTVSRIQAGFVDVRHESVAFGAAALDAVAAVGSTATVEDPNTATIWVDRDHLHRALINLISNAVKYGRPPISVCAVMSGADVEVRVRDCGDGIPGELAASLFEPFTRAESSRSLPGTGLGLSIVKGLVEANGGAVRYEHSAGEQSCFVLTLRSGPS